MRRTGVGSFTDALVPAALTAGLLLATAAGCAREDSSPGGASANVAHRQASAQVAPPAATPTPLAAQGREQFREALKSRFDTSRVIRRQDSPDGPVFLKPNGRVAHAVVAVKNSDGTIRRHCLSSAAEVDALMNRAGKEAQQ